MNRTLEVEGPRSHSGGLRSTSGLQAVVVPDPGNGWVRYRYAEKRWPRGVAPWPWVDLATGDLRGFFDTGGRRARHRGGTAGSSSRVTQTESLAQPTVRDDVVYLPPVHAALRPWRLRLAHGLRRLGTPVSLQLSLADVPALSTAPARLPNGPPQERSQLADAAQWLDLSSVVLEPAEEPLPERLERVCREWQTRWDPWRSGLGWMEAWVVLPLLPVLVVPQLSDVAAGIRRSGFGGVLPVAPRLSAKQRRHLAAAFANGTEARSRAPVDEELYDALFHGTEVDVDAAATQLEDAGLETMAARPLPGGNHLLRRRREAAGLLASSAELRRRAQRPHSQTQALVRAALWIDRHDIDVEGWLRDDHLRLVEEIGDCAEELLRAWLRDGARQTLTRERAELGLRIEQRSNGKSGAAHSER